MSIKKIEKNNKLAQDMIILIAGLQDAGMYKEADALSAKYALFKEAQSEFMNVIDEESRQILEFAHPGDCEIIPTKSDLGKIHTDTSRQLKIIETLNHAPTGMQVVAMAKEALGFKKKAQEEDEFSLSSQKYKNINGLIESYNEKVTSYNESLNVIKLEVPNLFKTPEAILSSKKHLLPYYVQKSGVDKKTIENFDKKIKYVGLDINLEEKSSIGIINEYILKFSANNSKESFVALNRAISELAPNSAKQYFSGTNNNSSVDLGWFKGEVAGLLTSAQWIQKLNEYKKSNNLFNSKSSSIFNGKIFAVKPSRWLEVLIPGSGMGFRGLFSSPEEEAKLRQEAYSKITLDIELSLNLDNVSAAANAIYQELLLERDALFNKKDEVSKFLLEKTSQLKELISIEKISSINDVTTVLSYITIANDNNNFNYSLISSDDIKVFIDYTSLFLAQYNNIKPVIDKLLEIAYEVDPGLKSFLSTKNTAVASLETILRHWKGVYEGLEEGSKMSATIAQYYSNILQVYKSLKSSKSINQLSSLTSSMPKAFKISSEEDIQALTDNLHADMDIFAKSQESSKEETVENVKPANFKNNLINKIAAGTGTFPVGGANQENKSNQSNQKTSPSFDSSKVTELQKAINKALGVSFDSSKSSDEQAKSSTGILALKEDGLFGAKTKDALEKLNNHFKLALPKLSKDTIQQIIDKINQIKSTRSTQRYLVKLDNAEIYYNDLLSLASFQKMLERLNPSKKEFTFKEWLGWVQEIHAKINDKTTLIAQNKQGVIDKLRTIVVNLYQIAQNSGATIEELYDVDLPAEVAFHFSKSVPNLGASNTSQKNPQRLKSGPYAQSEGNEQEDQSNELISLNNLIPFDGKYIYLKNMAELTGTDDYSSFFGPSIPLSIFKDSPEVSAGRYFSYYQDSIKAYKFFLESLKRNLGASLQSYILKLHEAGVPQYQIEAVQTKLNASFGQYINAINSSLNKINRPIRTPWK